MIRWPTLFLFVALTLAFLGGAVFTDRVPLPLEESLRKTLPGARIAADDRTGAATVVVDERGTLPSRAQVLAAFLDRCYRLYRESPALTHLRYRPRWRGRPLWT